MKQLYIVYNVNNSIILIDIQIEQNIYLHL